MLLIGKPKFIKDYYSVGNSKRKLLAKFDLTPIFYDGTMFYFGKNECSEQIKSKRFVQRIFLNLLLRIGGE